MRSSSTAVGFARWSALIVLTALGLLLLNDALFSGWVAGGPPNEHKLGWERRSLASLLLSGASFFAAGTAFRAIPRLPRIGMASWLLVLVSAALAASPFVAREILIDSCLDSGGRWSPAFLECER